MAITKDPLFLVYNRGSRPLLVAGRNLRPPPSFSLSAEVPSFSMHSAMLTRINEKNANLFYRLLVAQMVGLTEIQADVVQDVKRLRLHVTPHRHVSAEEFGKMFGLVADVAQGPSIPPPAPKIKEKAKAVPPEQGSLPVPEPPAPEPPAPEPPAPEPPAPEPPAPEPRYTVVVEPADDERQVLDLDLAKQIPWATLRHDYSAIPMQELRSFGELFDPTVKGTKKSDLVDELLRLADVHQLG